MQPGLTEVGADTVIVEAEDLVSRLTLDLALQLMATGWSAVVRVSQQGRRLPAGGFGALPARQRPGYPSRRVRRTGAVDRSVAIRLLVWIIGVSTTDQPA